METLATLRIFERDLMSTFLENEREVVEASLETRIDNLEKKTDQLLELFEEAPDDQAAWGQTFEANEKLYNTDTTSEESSDEDENEGGKKKGRRRRVRTSVPEVNPKTARISTARGARAQKRVEAQLDSIRSQLDRMREERDRTVSEAVAKALAEAGISSNGRRSQQSKKSFY